VLSLRQPEAAVDKAACPGVELADHHGVLAAIGETDQAQAVVRPQAVGALPDPVGLLGPGERIEVDQRLPLGIACPIALDGGRAPDAADVLRVLPEVAQRSVAGEADAGIRSLAVAIFRASA
jgi:hypothetical protein